MQVKSFSTYLHGSWKVLRNPTADVTEEGESCICIEDTTRPLHGGLFRSFFFFFNFFGNNIDGCEQIFI